MNSYLVYGPQDRKVAYFTMEVGLKPEMPTYSGGLGVLAGDTVKSFADKGVPVVAVTLLNEKGYFYQTLDDHGSQVEVPVNWSHRDHMNLLSEKVSVSLEGRDIMVQAWVHEVDGLDGFKVPVLFLDTNLDVNDPADRELTSYLYGGDGKYRLKQEAVLGVAGVRMLQILDHDNLEKYHMNEGHSAMLTLELMDRYQNDLERVRELCVFTTHTPVPAGHDVFPVSLVEEVLGGYFNSSALEHDKIISDGLLNMTYLALYHSNYVNGVAKKHREVAQKMYPQYRVDSITNGIHPATWVCDSMAALFDSYIPSWRRDPYTLRHSLSIPDDDLWSAHQKAKKQLLKFVNENYHLEFKEDVLTIGFARRVAAYKRADLLFSEPERLEKIAGSMKLQVIYGGKAHPHDTEAKKMIKRVWDSMREVDVPTVYLNNYDMYSAKLLVSGADVWLNTPMRPKEASGTSGMKAAVNGVLNFSVLDGWWLEGHVEDLTGWSIGPPPSEGHSDNKKDAGDLYSKLEAKVAPTYYKDRRGWTRMVAYNIAFNGSFFNTHRMVDQYVTQAYFQ